MASSSSIVGAMVLNFERHAWWGEVRAAVGDASDVEQIRRLSGGVKVTAVRWPKAREVS
jgi:hypothetical protein